MAHCVAECERQGKATPAKDARSRARLQEACEDAKKELTLTDTASVYIDWFPGGGDDSITIEISRGEFERLCYDEVNRCLTIICKLLAR